MSGFVFLIVLVSALFHASWNALLKGGTNKLFETAMNLTGGGLVSLAAIFVLPVPARESWPYLAAGIPVYVLYYVFLIRAYSSSEFGYAYTMMRGGVPLLTALASALLFDEALSGAGLAGVLLLSFGLLVLALDSIGRGGFSREGTLLALANAVVITGYTVLDGRGARLSGHAAAYTCWIFFLNAFPLFILTATRYRAAYIPYARAHWKRGLLGGACSVLAYGMALWGMTRAPIPLVAALRETSVIFGVLLGALFLKEKLTPGRVAAVALVAAGAGAMRLPDLLANVFG